jgi:hypothetical protein
LPDPSDDSEPTWLPPDPPNSTRTVVLAANPPPLTESDAPIGPEVAEIEMLAARAVAAGNPNVSATVPASAHRTKTRTSSSSNSRDNFVFCSWKRDSTRARYDTRRSRTQ